MMMNFWNNIEAAKSVEDQHEGVPLLYGESKKLPRMVNQTR